jgi:hypothetical protein
MAALDSTHCGTLRPILIPVIVGAVLDEAFNEIDIAGLDRGHKAFEGRLPLRRHILSIVQE